MGKYIRLSLIFACILVYSCGKDVSAPLNLAPNVFEVNVVRSQDENGIVLTWGKATDPENDSITYSVLIKGETKPLVFNLKTLSYTFEITDFNKTYSGEVVATDSKNNATFVPFSIIINTAPTYVMIPDKNFEFILIANSFDKERLYDGKISKKDALLIQNLMLNDNNHRVEDLSGIENFTNLVQITSLYNGISNVNLSNNSMLEEVTFEYSKLEQLDVSKNLKLKRLVTVGSPIKSLDLTKNLNLTYLSCKSNNLTVLNISKNKLLTNLYTKYNLLLTSIIHDKNANKEYWFKDDATNYVVSP